MDSSSKPPPLEPMPPSYHRVVIRVVAHLNIQIDLYEQQIQLGDYRESDLNSSIALVSVAGNDYGAYFTRNGKPEGVKSLVESVVNQTAVNLKRILGLGVQKVAVMGLLPVGCIPLSTANSSYTRYDASGNRLVVYHNSLLQKAIDAIKVPSAAHSPSLFLISTLPSPPHYKVRILSPFPCFLDPHYKRPFKPGMLHCRLVINKGSRKYQRVQKERGQSQDFFVGSGQDDSPLGLRSGQEERRGPTVWPNLSVLVAPLGLTLAQAANRLGPTLKKIMAPPLLLCVITALLLFAQKNDFFGSFAFCTT
ncbi:GDSL esterase/lipase [Nymphaea thermarum]|nr:GDSL esterase/lipase [Nymphaea thermarum]